MWASAWESGKSGRKQRRERSRDERKMLLWPWRRATRSRGETEAEDCKCPALLLLLLLLLHHPRPHPLKWQKASTSLLAASFYTPFWLFDLAPKTPAPLPCFRRFASSLRAKLNRR